jgi:NADPH-dependent 2,4-dienoyl-CoA reductase/sulfur reductase-like enzyme
MRSTKYLLIGAGLASSQAAREIRDADPEGSILLVGEEPHVPYDRPPLSKEFLRGEKSREELFYDLETFYREHTIDLALGVRVEALDPDAKCATLSGGETVSFQKALIATGGRPVRPDLPGAGRPGVHTLHTMDEAVAIAAAAEPGRHATLVGAGFIGLEVAASLTQRGVQVTVIEAQPRIWPRFADALLAGRVQAYCEQKGVTFITGDAIVEIVGNETIHAIYTHNGRQVRCDFVCFGVGIVPNAELAREARLAVTDGIVVDAHLRTSHPDIYAAGDVVNYPDPIFGKRRRVEHWGHAEHTGQIAGRNMAGGESAYDHVTTVWSDIFDLHLEFAGDESEHDVSLIRGSLEENAFIQLYLQDGRLRAYFAINGNAKDFPILQRLIRGKKDLASKIAALEDPDFSLRDLL